MMAICVLRIICYYVEQFYPHLRFQVLTAASMMLAHSSLMMEAVRTSETSVDNHFTRQYIPEDNSEQFYPHV
jgi:hypothetical protein